MTQNTLLSLCWIALGLSAVGAIGAAAIGAAYHPQNGVLYLAGAVAPVIGIGALLFALPRARGAVWLILLLSVACAGVGLVGFFAYQLARDGGDALLWLPPFLLGLGLVGLVFVGGPASTPRGEK